MSRKKGMNKLKGLQDTQDNSLNRMEGFKDTQYKSPNKMKRLQDTQDSNPKIPESVNPVQDNGRPGYKHTSLGWIPHGWEVKRFTDICELKHGFQFREEHFVEHGVPIIKIGSLVNGAGIRTDNLTYVHRDIADQCSTFRVKPGDILMALTGGTLGKVSVFPKVEGVYLQNYRVGNFLSKNSSTKDYILQLLQSYFIQTKIEDYVNEAAQPNFGKQDFDKLKVPVPPLPEQRRIAAILSAWDEAITKTQQLIAQLQQRNKGLMQQLLKPNGDWQEKRMSDIFERVVRRNTNGNTNVITISAQRGFVKQIDFFKKLVASETLDNYFLVKKGEFCYNKSYSNGYDWGATKRLNDFDEAVVTTLYICFNIKDEEEYSGDYFEYFFDANILDRGLAKIAHEGGRAHGLLNVTPSNFFSLKIYVPPYDEQQRIFKVLSAAKNELKLYEQTLAALQQQKKGLMQKLLTGEVRVK